ncbi:hypothetical protein C8N46_104106 [Kordia periserrulae]|uniref:Uncharacterized protein n=1 Tax=Kordia periserrulae TaxID=701523 RepID=A0A2T6BZG8_9FLAO|nr:hypothetical protein [Kordia periserrulae]PTX61463.1 hypothetical protein C8N46_104106 [Kordia periserrulae]
MTTIPQFLASQHYLLPRYFPEITIAQPQILQNNGDQIKVTATVMPFQNGQSAFYWISELKIFLSFVGLQLQSGKFGITFTYTKSQNTLTIAYGIQNFSIHIDGVNADIDTPTLDITLNLQSADTIIDFLGYVNISAFDSKTYPVLLNFQVDFTNKSLSSFAGSLSHTFSKPKELLSLPPELKGLTLNAESLGIEAGMIVEPPIALLGISASGTVKTAKETLHVDDFAIICTPDADFAPLYISFSFGEITLAEALQFANPSAMKVEALANIPVVLKEPEFTWCEKSVPLINGTTASPGISFQGMADIFGFQVYASFKQNNGQFQSCLLQFDGPLTFSLHGKNILALAGEGKAILGNPEVKNWEVPLNSEDAYKIKHSQPKTICKSGGAVINVDTNDHEIFGSAQVTFLNMEMGIVDLNVNEHEISFDTRTQISHFIHQSIQFSLYDNQVYVAYTSHVDVKIPLLENMGIYNFNNDIAVASTITHSNFMAEIQFELMGTTHNIYSIDISHCSSIEEIQEVINNQLIEKLPAILMEYLMANPLQLIKLFQTGHILIEKIEQAATFLTSMLQKLGIPIPDMTPYISEIGKMYHISAQQLTEAIKSLYGESEVVIKETGKMLLKVPYLPSKEVAAALKTTFNAGQELVTEIFYGVGIGAKETAEILENIYGMSAEGIADLMKQVGYTADAIGEAFEEVGGKLVKVGEEIINHVFHFLPWSPFDFDAEKKENSN